MTAHGKRAPQSALVLRWQAPDRPLPRRAIGAVQPAAPRPAVPIGCHTGPPGMPFDFCGRVRGLLHDIAARCPELGHVRVPDILVSVTQARGTRVHGLQARVTPLRFAGGALVRQRRGITYQVQRYFEGDHEFLYLMTFCLPRFLDQPFDAKLVTLVHELYHIGPRFDGDLRRHEGRYQLHSRCRHAYDRQMAEMARRYLASRPDPDRYAFLRLSFAQLQERHRQVVGIVVPRPKIVPLLGQSVAAYRSAPQPFGEPGPAHKCR